MRLANADHILYIQAGCAQSVDPSSDVGIKWMRQVTVEELYVHLGACHL